MKLAKFLTFLWTGLQLGKWRDFNVSSLFKLKREVQHSGATSLSYYLVGLLPSSVKPPFARQEIRGTLQIYRRLVPFHCVLRSSHLSDQRSKPKDKLNPGTK